MTLPPRLARARPHLEFRVAPPLYRRTPIVTLSESSKDELVAQAAPPAASGSRSCRPGIDPSFSPGRHRDRRRRSSSRSAGSCPVKRFHALIDALGRRAAAPARVCAR